MKWNSTLYHFKALKYSRFQGVSLHLVSGARAWPHLVANLVRKMGQWVSFQTRRAGVGHGRRRAAAPNNQYFHLEKWDRNIPISNFHFRNKKLIYFCFVMRTGAVGASEPVR